MIDKKRQNNANREKETWLRRPVTIIEYIVFKMIFEKAPYAFIIIIINIRPLFVYTRKLHFKRVRDREKRCSSASKIPSSS